MRTRIQAANQQIIKLLGQRRLDLRWGCDAFVFRRMPWSFPGKMGKLRAKLGHGPPQSQLD